MGVVRYRKLSHTWKLERCLRCLKAELDSVDQEVKQFLKEHQELKEEEMLLRAAKSIERVTATTLLSDLVEPTYTENRYKMYENFIQ